jgi:alanyl-tRNA synthetase
MFFGRRLSLKIKNFKQFSTTNLNNLKWDSKKVRSTFIDYYTSAELSNKHKMIPSSSVLPLKGMGTYFTNAGMNQFKSIIVGKDDPNDYIDMNKFSGVVNSQKCIRIGGKHSDLDDIGSDTYHHTFFEMLGNWSFGNTNKQKTCEMALNLLVNVYKFNVKGLYFTYFQGDQQFNLKEDLETKNIWKGLGIDDDHILPFGMKENFWEMALTGPCGNLFRNYGS